MRRVPKAHLHGGFVTESKFMGLQVVLVVKNLPAHAGDVRDVGSIPASRRSPGGGHGNPLQYSCLENPTGREVWRATGHSVENSRTQLKLLSMHTRTRSSYC